MPDIQWDITPIGDPWGIQGAGVAEVGDMCLSTEPQDIGQPFGPALWRIETPDRAGGAVVLREGIATSAAAARATAEVVALDVAAAVAAFHAAPRRAVSRLH